MLVLLLAAACLPIGFAVADVTGLRPLGGAVLVALAVAAVAQSSAGWARRGAWAGIVLAAFAASHWLAGPLGTWGAIALVTAITTLAAHALLLSSVS